MRTPEDWQRIARAVTDDAPPLTDEQRGGLTRLAQQHATRKATENITSRIIVVEADGSERPWDPARDPEYFDEVERARREAERRR
jgi:hypothetical protein